MTTQLAKVPIPHRRGRHPVSAGWSPIELDNHPQSDLLSAVLAASNEIAFGFPAAEWKLASKMTS